MNKKLLPLFALSALLLSCGGDSGTGNGNDDLSSGNQITSSGTELSSVALLSSEANSSGTDGSSTTTTTSSGSGSSSSKGTSSAKGTSSTTGASSATGTSSVTGTSSTTTTSSTTVASSSAGTLPPGSTFTDPRDNQVYKIVQIGNQVWFAENLNYGTFHTGATEQSNDNKVEKFCYNDVEANCDTYGGLYYWTEMMGLSYNCLLDMAQDSCQQKIKPKMQGICPTGWHVPDTTEFRTLANQAKLDYPGYDNAVLRDETFGSQQYPGLDKYGFTALGSGSSSFCGPGCTSFTLGTEYEAYWANTLAAGSLVVSSYFLEIRGNRNDFAIIFTGGLSLDNGLSVRCIRD